MILVFPVGDQAILAGTAKHPSLCLYLGKHFVCELQECSDVQNDWNFDYDDPVMNGNLFDLYSQ